jgi:threonine dehydratase
MAPGCRVWGVEPAAGNDVQQSLARGEIVRLPEVPRTLADGAQTQAPGGHTFAVMREKVDGVVTVDDAALVRTMAFLAERLKVVVEPTGCLAAAAVLEGARESLPDLRGTRVGIVLSGGNIDLARFAALVTAPG